MSECVDKNMIDKDEYPQTAEIESRAVHILADLWHSPEPRTTTELLLDDLRDAVAYLDSLPRCPRSTGPTPSSTTDEEDHPRSVPDRG